jgi:SAM-dependent methyltransferase
MDMLYRRSAESAGWTAASIARRLPQLGHALDLGGGHGRYAEALVSKGFKATLFDRSVCVALARERYGDLIDTLVGDFMVDALGGPYDVILLSNIVHGLGRDENRRLLLRLREVVQPGGLLVVKDMFLDRTRSQPEAAAFFGMTMQMYTREGRCYSVDDWAQLWQETGFSAAGVEDVPDLRYSLVFGRRD